MVHLGGGFLCYGTVTNLDSDKLKSCTQGVTATYGMMKQRD